MEENKVGGEDERLLTYAVMAHSGEGFVMLLYNIACALRRYFYILRGKLRAS